MIIKAQILKHISDQVSLVVTQVPANNTFLPLIFPLDISQQPVHGIPVLNVQYTAESLPLAMNPRTEIRPPVYHGSY